MRNAMRLKERLMRVFSVRNLIYSGLFFSSLVITIFSMNLYDVGSSEEISLQISDGVIFSEQQAVDTEAAFTYESIDDLSNDDVFMALATDLDALINKNTFVITENTQDSGIPDELTDVSTFTPVGAPAWISTNQVNVRANPSVSSEVVAVLDYSNEVVCLSNGINWTNIRLEDGTEGFVLTSLLSEEQIVAPTPLPTPTPTPIPMAPSSSNVGITGDSGSSASATESAYSATMYASCSLNVRSGPGVNYSLVSVLTTGQEISIVAQTDNGWYKTSTGNYVKASLCSSVPVAAPIAPSTSVDVASPTSDFATYCLSFVGTPYVYAGMSPSGFDCSGYVSYIMANYYGVSLPHNASEISQLGTSVTAEEIQAGDVMCHDYNGDGYIDHVSLYIGDGTCVHASNSRSGVVSCAFPMGSVVTIRRFI
ncbi:MAG TPA: NlpC/P60 family protein [Saccharofermentans sp.]|nr:NlpC/P60 family protein [Saccharofermentans sp.]